jgi:UrcA family protein
MTYTISLAAIAFTATLAIAGASNAAVTVKVGDLNLANPAQAQELKVRVDKAARDFCRANFNPTADATLGKCRQAIRAEVYEKVAARQTALVQVANR